MFPISAKCTPSADTRASVASERAIFLVCVGARFVLADYLPSVWLSVGLYDYRTG